MNIWTKIVLILLTISNIFAENNSNSLKDIESQCKTEIVESIPMGLTFNGTVVSNSTFDSLMSLVSKAEQSIEIASFYWSLLGTDVMPDPDKSSLNGKQLLDAIIDSSKSRSIKIRIAINANKDNNNNTDLKLLGSVADIRELNFKRLIGAGILHTKFIVVDNKHFYIGSANMDWRSLTQVKELGIVFTDCQVLAKDLMKIFEIYWYLGQQNATIPKQWPKELSTNYNESHPLLVSINDLNYNVFMSSAPKQFCSLGRTNDIDAILATIKRAKKFIYISIMDYFPQYLFSYPKYYWPVIDDELRRAVIERRVNVRLLASRWNHTRASMPFFLKSLSAFNNQKIFKATLEAKLFIVPSFTPFQANIPHARVNHNKYMITDKTAYIGTSNWSADYFVSTGGAGISMTHKHNDTNIRDQLQAIFERDWESSYAQHV